MWDHEIALTTYSTPEVRTYVVNNLNVIGSLARHWNIRLSFHPDQFVVIASPNPEVATRGIATLESVAEITRLMGYTGWHPDGFAINIHAGAASVTTEQLRDAITNRLSEQARNLLTLENDEFSHNLYDLCQLKDVVAIVPDLHHEWINEGWYTGAGSNCMRDVLESWRGVRPKLHLAMSREHLIPDEVKNDQLLDLHDLVFRNGLTKSKLRAHSDSPWHTPTLDYARHFHEHFDIMWEGKDKNLGQEIIYNHYNNRNEND
jgi:UV DNA damage repair endonuclease